MILQKRVSKYPSLSSQIKFDSPFSLGRSFFLQDLFKFITIALSKFSPLILGGIIENQVDGYMTSIWRQELLDCQESSRWYVMQFWWQKHRKLFCKPSKNNVDIILSPAKISIVWWGTNGGYLTQDEIDCHLTQRKRTDIWHERKMTGICLKKKWRVFDPGGIWWSFDPTAKWRVFDTRGIRWSFGPREKWWVWYEGNLMVIWPEGKMTSVIRGEFNGYLTRGKVTSAWHEGN